MTLKVKYSSKPKKLNSILVKDILVGTTFFGRHPMGDRALWLRTKEDTIVCLTDFDIVMNEPGLEIGEYEEVDSVLDVRMKRPKDVPG